MSDSVLNARVLVERATIRPASTEDLHVVIDLTAHGSPVETKRPRLSVMFCIDASTSMTGEPLAQVIASAGMIIDLLDDSDEVGLVAFASEASLISELSTLTPASRAMLRRRTAMIKPSGNTNMQSGLETAFRAFPARADDVRQVLLMLSDGEPNRGMTSVEQLSGLIDRSRAQVGIVMLGYGSGHNSAMLHDMAKAGGGQYWFIPDPSEAQSEFARALGAQGDIVSEQNEVALMPAEGVEIVEVLNVEKTRFTRDGLLVSVPDLREQQNHKVVARLRVTAPSDNGPFPPVTVLVRHRPVGTKTHVDERLVPTFGVADRDPADVVEALHAVLLAQAEQTRVKARAEADIGRFDGAARLLRAVLERLQRAPGYVVNDGSPLSEAIEQLVDEVTAYERKPSAKEYMEFKATALGVDVAQGAKHAADIVGQSQIAVRMQQATTSAVSVGTLVIFDQQGREHGRVPLAGELIIGRVAGNDIVLPRGNISKRHARVVVRDGKAIVVDLKTTNGTYVNGQRVQSPVILSPNDKIMVGEFAMRFDAAPDTSLTSATPPLSPRSPVVVPDEETACHLVVTDPVTGRMRQRYALASTGEVFIGSNANLCGIVLPDLTVEEKHTRIVARGNTVHFADMMSARGTFLNGERAFEGQRLCPEDVLSICGYTIHVEGLRHPTNLMVAPDPPLAKSAPLGLRSAGNAGQLVVTVQAKFMYRVDIPATGEVYIGRRGDRDIVMNHEPSGVPSPHARIVSRSGRVIVFPEGQSTTTLRNGIPLKRVLPLDVGDTLVVGPFQIQRAKHVPGTAPSAPSSSGESTSPPANTSSASVGTLVVVDQQGQVHARVPLAGEITLGRDPAADVQLVTRAVGKQHARIVVRDGKVILVDLKSQNGTFLNEERLTTPRILRFGDVVRIGHFTLEFTPSSTTPAPPPVDDAFRPQVADARAPETGPVTPAAISSSLSSSGAFFEIQSQGGDPWRYTLPSSAVTVIGCMAENDIVLKSSAVARRHARIATSEGRILVEDLRSTNGTFVNGVRVTTPRVLVEGDRVYIGDATLRLCFDPQTT